MKYAAVIPIDSGRSVYRHVRGGAWPCADRVVTKVGRGGFGAGAVRRHPFVAVADDRATARSFMDALTSCRLDAAQGLVSKSFAGSVDVYELAAAFEGSAACKMIDAGLVSCPRNCKVKSVMVMDSSSALCAVLHLHMLREPDSVSNWKIYSVERES